MARYKPQGNNWGQTPIKSELTFINLYKLVCQPSKYKRKQLLFS